MHCFVHVDVGASLVVYSGSIRSVGVHLEELEEIRIFGTLKSGDKAGDDEAKKLLCDVAVGLQKLSADIGGANGLMKEIQKK